MKKINRLYVLMVLSIIGVTVPPISYSDSSKIYSRDFYRLLRTNSCPRCDLYKAPLSGLNLTNADLQGANLVKADLRNATLYKADLSGASLGGANLEGATWIDGATCQRGSVGRCVKDKQE
jgi:hypothetical protein